ncbi:inositol monophosphatase family protein [Candidatus Halocynthiibacter alkanivorans]|uniref:inositol monophosphatase family protein n=1 Tax=Candidatus Halocynthiibacter alkanivorans TaxID=2267619 RepID=UPI000DF4412F|nr:3'(2'),5'-bisphosphate nucleotidase CysQ [Candidatus Halocynthiibacter alkanivorans]
MPANSDLTLLSDAARAAGDIAKPYWRADPQTWDKGDGAGPVSEADLAVNRMLHAELQQARPGYGWLSEESEDSRERLEKDRVFIIDPIDGTRAFLNGDSHWSHSLAIAEQGQVIAAAVYLPVLDRLYLAARGSGATLNGEKISVSARREIDGATVLAAKRVLEPAFWPGGIPPVERHFRPSLAYRLSLVAQGRFDAMLVMRDTWEWDVAAGSLLVQEAGGEVTDSRGNTLRFNNPRPALKGMIAAPSPIHSILCRHLQPTATNLR